MPDARWVLIVSATSLGCGLPPPKPSAPACYPEASAAPRPHRAWRPLPPGWVRERGTLPEQLFTCDLPGADRQRAFGGPLAEPYGASREGALAQVGGDYWKGPYDIGSPGGCRLGHLDTAGPSARAGVGRGSVLSDALPSGHAYVTFLVGGGGGDRTEVGLCVDTGAGRCEAVTAAGCRTHGPGVLGMERFTCEVGKLGLAERALRLRVADDTAAVAGDGRYRGLGFVLVDDLRAVDAPPPPQAPPLWGFVDLHAHVFNHLGSGGRLVHGKVFDPDCQRPRDPACMKRALGTDCTADHNTGGRTFTTEPFCHDTRGFPRFEGWPRHGSIAHQQVYIDWIERAYRGGLRLVQVDVGNNRVFAEAYEELNVGSVPALRDGERRRGDHALTHAFGEDEVRRVELRAAQDFVDGPARAWAGIARSAAEARSLAREGKLVIVPGLEADAPGDDDYALLEAVQDSPAAVARPVVRAYVKKLWDEGVRHFFPIHLMPSLFGDPSVYDRKLFCAGIPETGVLVPLVDGFPSDVRYHVNRDVEDAEEIFLELFMSNSLNGTPLRGLPGRYERRTGSALGDCYRMGVFTPLRALRSPQLASRLLARDAYALPSTMAEGTLSKLGEIFIEELMRAGMLIDLTHMGQRTRTRTFELAERYGYPLMASHTGLRQVAFGHEVAEEGGRCLVKPRKEAFNPATTGAYGTLRVAKTSNEHELTDEEVRRVGRLEGMVGLVLATEGVGVQLRERIPNDCDGTTKSFAQPFLHARELLEGRGLAVGTDVNGFLPLPPPRFRTLPPAAASASKPSCPPIHPPDHDKDACGGAAGDALRWGEYGYGPGNWPQDPNTMVVYRFDQRVYHQGEGLVQRAPIEGYSVFEGDQGKRFDVNYDGVAHYGLLPDYLQDLHNVGVDADELAALFGGLEHYLRMWERVEHAAARARAAIP